jgi:hypothetical protein
MSVAFKYKLTFKLELAKGTRLRAQGIKMISSLALRREPHALRHSL